MNQQTTEIYTLSLHDALPICDRAARGGLQPRDGAEAPVRGGQPLRRDCAAIADRASPGARRRCHRGLSRSEEHTSELQSHVNLVCRLLLEKKKYHNHLFGVKN